MNLTRWKSPSQRNEDTPDFRYAPLKSTKTSIRLAQILPGSGNKGIAIQLIDSFVTGSGQTPYDALSYTWGEGTRSKTITCNGKRLTVTRTLLEALQRFRDPDHPVTLWIDQICICQARLKERNQQVQMMGDIFRSARKVLVWLGEDYDDSRAGMQLAKQLLHIAQYQHVSGLGPADLEPHGLPRRGHKRWKALAAVLRRPWFWRTWVVQEVVLNPHVELVLGAAILTWCELESIVALLEGPIPKIWQLDQAISASELPFSRINRIRFRHRRMITTPVTPTNPNPGFDTEISTEPAPLATDHYSDEDDPELLDLLLMSRSLGATDPRDKIYALLGLGKHDIKPDYSMSPESVFTDFALQTIGMVTAIRARRDEDEEQEETTTNPELPPNSHEVRRAMVLLACAGRQNQRLALPSWVPDWTVNLASRPLVFGLGHDNRRYAAGGTQLGVFDWHFDLGLQLSGLLLDTIQAVGCTFLDSVDPNGVGVGVGGTNNARDPHALIAAWWREAQLIALERIARSPGSTLHTDAFEAMRRRLSLCKHGYYLGDDNNNSASPPHLQPKRRAGSSLLDDAELAGGTTTSSWHSASQTLTLGPTRGRVMFASATGFLGLVPYGAREGDVVFVIRGADVPVVLRGSEGGEGGFELIGEAYVQGVMEGEALGMGGLGWQDVRIR